MESNFLHRPVFIKKVNPTILFLYLLRKHKWIETQLLKGSFNPVFSTVSLTS